MADSTTTRPPTTLYIANLAPTITPSTLHAAFIPFGTIENITLPKPELASSKDSHRGFGYVEFELEEDAREAMDNMDQSELFGRVIRVAAAKPGRGRGEGEEGLGSKTAVWEQEGYMAKHGGGIGGGAGIEEADDGKGLQNGPSDPMQGLEQLDVAGPKPA